MSEVRLTKDADVMICILYKEYLQPEEIRRVAVRCKVFWRC